MDGSPLSDAELIKKSLQKLKVQNARVKELELAQDEPLAVVGMAGRFPNAENLNEFWALLTEGRDAITELPEERINRHYWKDYLSKTTTLKGGFLKGNVYGFDAQYFGISPREAQYLDPQQRILLEVCLEAFENAHIDVDDLKGSNTGFYLGMSTDDYSRNLDEIAIEDLNAYISTGNAYSTAAGRVSYTFGLTGPCMTVDTACSSSLVAIHQAMSGLRNRECDSAVVAGVGLILSLYNIIFFSQAGMLSPSGRCNTFDSSADGYIRGEGCGVVILKRLSDAQRDNDEIVAIIRGSSINQDGSSAGLTVPNGTAQAKLIRDTIAKSKLTPDDIDYVEAHGTGTNLGDPIELTALGSVFATKTRQSPLRIGSVKTNIGHLEAAAGIASFIKMCLAIKNNQLPPHLHCNNPTGHVDWESLNLKVNLSNNELAKSGKVGRVGVSSFGFSGTNTHLILERPPVHQEIEEPANNSDYFSKSVMIVSAKSRESFDDLVLSYKNHLLNIADVDVKDFCFSTQLIKRHSEFHASVLVGSKVDAIANLNKLLARELSEDIDFLEKRNIEKNKLALFFNASYSISIALLKSLYPSFDTFKIVVDNCESYLKENYNYSFKSAVFTGNIDELNDKDPQLASQVIAVSQLALASQLSSWGVSPSVVCGVGPGNLVAGCVANIFDFKTMCDFLMANHAGSESIINTANKKIINARLYRPSISYIRSMLDVTNSDSLLNTSYWREEIVSFIIAESNLFKAKDTGYVITIEPVVDESVLGNEYKSDSSSISIASIFKNGVDEKKPSVLTKGVEGFLLRSLSKAFSRCANVQWRLCYLSQTRKKANLPSYPFNRTAYFYSKDSQPQIDMAHGRKPISSSDNGNFIRQLSGMVFDSTRGAEDILSEVRSLITNGGGKRLFYQRQWKLLSNTEDALKNLGAKNIGQAANCEFLIFADEHGIGTEIGRRLAEKGRQVNLIDFESANACSDAVINTLNTVFEKPDNNAIEIIYLWGLNIKCSASDSSETLLKGIKSLSEPLLAVANLAINYPNRQVSLSLISSGAYNLSIVENPTNSLIQSSLWGIAQTFAIEIPQLFRKIIDIENDVGSVNTSALENILNLESDEKFLKYSGNELHTLRITDGELGDFSLSTKGIEIRKQKIYLVTGGFGHLGLNVIKYLARKGAIRIVVASRNAPSAFAESQLQKISGNGLLKIESRLLDISDNKAVAELFSYIDQLSGQLSGVVHCAGTIADGLASSMRWEQFSKVLYPKVCGAWNLHQHTLNLPLDFFVMFSSAASFFGSPGQCNYVVANSFMDALAQYRKNLGLPALAINWGPWQEGGMADTLSELQRERQRATGIQPLPVNTAIDALDQLLPTSVTQVAVMDMDANVVKLRSPAGLSQMLSGIVSDNISEESKLDSALEKLKALSGNELKIAIKQYISGVISQVMKLTVEQLEDAENLLELGMDSLMAMEILTTVKNGIHLNLYPREIYENPRLSELADYVAVEFEKSHKGDVDINAPSGESVVTTLPQRTKKIFTANKAIRKTTGVAFILSSPRSGSTLLRSMLAGHSKLFSPPELHLLPFEDMRERDNELKGSYMDEGLVRSLMELTGDSALECQTKIQNWIEENRSVNDIYLELHLLCGDRLLIDKSPSYGDDIAVLQRAELIFDKPKYIHLTRHPLSVIESFARMRMNNLIGLEDANPYQVAEQIWVRSNQNIRDFFSGHTERERCLTVAYEDLVKTPKQTMRIISEFLNITVEESLFNPYGVGRMTDGVTEKSLSIGDPNFLNYSGVVTDLVDRWKTKKLSYTLNTEADTLARDMNYFLSTSDEVIDGERRESFVEINGHSLCVSEWGRAEDPLIICIHGIMDQGPIWEPCAKALVKQGYRIVAPDLRGHGLSSHSDEFGGGQITDLVADLDSLALSLKANKFTLVGHSMGTIVTSLYAACRPENIERLIQVEPVVPTPNRYSYAEHLRRRLALNAIPSQHPKLASVDEGISRLERAHPSMPQSQLKALASRMLKQENDYFVWTWDPRLTKRSMLNFTGKGREDYLEILDTLIVPMTLVFGIESPFNRTDDLAQLKERLYQASTFELMGSHGVHYEQPIELANIISHQIKIAQIPQERQVFATAVESVARKNIYQIDKV